jgi:hypothetical protein
MRRRRSLFGPMLLIAAGVLLLLVQTGRVPLANLWALAYVWPVLLIFAGLGLILRRSLPWLWDVMAILVVVALLLAVIFAPQLGLSTTPLTGATPFFAFGSVATGNVVREDRPVSAFDAVSIEYPADVTISQGSNESLSIEAPSDILPQIRTEVRGSTLHISPPPGLIPLLRPQTGLVRIEITVKDLSSVQFSSAGRVDLLDLQTDDLRVSISGAGSFDITNLTTRNLEIALSGAGSLSASGRSTISSVDVNLSGVGSYDGGELRSTTADVAISGAGSATVWVTDRLTAHVSGLGSVRYFGSPSVTKQVSGLGGVQSLGDK